MNYDLEMEKQIKNIKEGDTLLLHACCAPCSSACLERLGDYFNISIFYYNPNITEKDEYIKRINEIKKFISEFKTKYPIKLIEGRYDPNEFFDMAKGLESEPERGSRCYKCYKLRLKESAKVASDLGFDYFCTTLTLSPHKNNRKNLIKNIKVLIYILILIKKMVIKEVLNFLVSMIYIDKIIVDVFILKELRWMNNPFLFLNEN